MRYFAFLLFFTFFLISGCENALTGNAGAQNVYEDITAEAYFCPREDCSKIIKNMVDSAEKSVHCAFFDLDLKNLINALAKKSHNADVKVIIDKNNYDSQIKGDGVRVVKSSQYMHNKFCIIDKSLVLTGSTNPTNNGAGLNNNNIVILASRYLAENYEDEFDELWNGIYASGDNVKYNKIHTDKGFIENYFCPEDCQETGGVKRVASLVSEATESVKAAIFSFTDEELADELLKADIRGVNVTVLVESRQRNVMNSQYKRLKDFGVDIKVDSNKYNMHHKFTIIDGSIVITGSPNYSWSGNNRNDENMVVIYDKSFALEFIKEFNSIFDEAEVI
ncbi:hypothetical protein KY347_04985 [Candidatus Woesearchaeota archaeon]|nr:hypothetical protein [Candidatus Woesearchaeota archaeon]